VNGVDVFAAAAVICAVAALVAVAPRDVSESALASSREAPATG
jgi:hypothetical protein